MIRFSRRQLAVHAAKSLAQGDKSVIDRLAAYLVDSGRTKELPLIVSDIEKALEGEGLLLARVSSARPLDNEQEATIKQLLQTRHGLKEIQLEKHVDPDLLGGVVIQSAKDEFDGSLKRSIKRLKALNV